MSGDAPSLNSKGITAIQGLCVCAGFGCADDILYFAGDLFKVETMGYRYGLQLVTSETEDALGRSCSSDSKIRGAAAVKVRSGVLQL